MLWAKVTKAMHFVLSIFGRSEVVQLAGLQREFGLSSKPFVDLHVWLLGEFFENSGKTSEMVKVAPQPTELDTKTVEKYRKMFQEYQKHSSVIRREG